MKLPSTLKHKASTPAAKREIRIAHDNADWELAHQILEEEHILAAGRRSAMPIHPRRRKPRSRPHLVRRHRQKRRQRGQRARALLASPQVRLENAFLTADALHNKEPTLRIIIENSFHWVLDTAFREYHNQTYVGNAAKNLSTVRRIVMNLLRIDITYPNSTPKRRMRALMDKKYREHLLSLA